MTPGPDEQMERLLAAEAAGDTPLLLLFWGHTAGTDRPGPWVLSQWWPAPFQVDDVRYRHAEGFMMAEKARLFGDDAMRGQILAADHPGDAKKLGRQVRGYSDMWWHEHCYDIVVRGSLAKFGQHDDLRAYLLSTAPSVLVEASPRDAVWGIGLGAEDERVARPREWKGRNLLGFALTAVRELLA